MPACLRRAVAMFTDCVTADDIEATARRTGFVKRTSKMTGKLFLPLVTVGTWSEAKTTLAPWAAQVTQWDQDVAGAPEALHQRMHKQAMAVLQDMIRQALAQVQSLEPVCDDGLFPSCTKGYRADRTGCALPDSVHTLLPGSGGSASKAGATMQAVWDSKNSGLDHCALPPWTIPDQKYIDHGVA